jgi:hypothetical protein
MELSLFAIYDRVACFETLKALFGYSRTLGLSAQPTIQQQSEAQQSQQTEEHTTNK